MAPFQTTVTIRNERIQQTGQNTADIQAMPEEENWTENTTAVTGNTSERSESLQGIDEWVNDAVFLNTTYHRYMVTIVFIILVGSTLLSPLVMVALPRLGLFHDSSLILTIQQKLIYSACDIECKGLLLALSFKVTLLGVGNWAIFFKSREAVMPRIYLFRAVSFVLTTICVCSYWLFYSVQITEGSKTALVGDVTAYKSLVNYAGNFSETLLFIHFITILLIEIRHLKPTFYLKIVRTPDGVSRSYLIGDLSIQRAAVWILQHYYADFSIYNPYLERLPLSKSVKKQNLNYKFYNVDSNIAKSDAKQNEFRHTRDRAVSSTEARRKDSNHNERFLEEYEYDRRVKKRKARLITITEEAFAHIQRVNSYSEQGTHPNLLNPMEAAQSIFPSLARALQKYLRITRQQPYHSVQTILERLAFCLAQDATPRVFLEPFFILSPVLSSAKEKLRDFQHWALVCDGTLPSRSITHGCQFQLRQGEVALLCSIHHLPRLCLTEQITLIKSNKFLLKINTETTT